MTTANDLYWKAVEQEEAVLRSKQPTTAMQVVSILKEYDPQSPERYSGDAFYSGSNGDYCLADILVEAGWDIEWLDGDIYWIATHPETGSRLRYCEGDVDDETDITGLM